VPLIKDGKVQRNYRDDDDDDDDNDHPRRKRRTSRRGMREELDWDKKKYRGKKGRKR